MSVLQIVTLVLEAILGLFTAYAAYSLFTWTPPSVAKMREALHFPRWYWALAGFVATVGAIGLFAGLAFPPVAALAALWMVAYFVVATSTHLVRKDFASLGMPLLFLAIFVGLLVLRWPDATPVLALVGR
jgi:uncharacterized membrane protein YphA (DoxX/SURF4 family)